MLHALTARAKSSVNGSSADPGRGWGNAPNVRQPEGREMTATEILKLLEGVKPEGKGWKAKCSAHDDKAAIAEHH